MDPECLPAEQKARAALGAEGTKALARRSDDNSRGPGRVITVSAPARTARADRSLYLEGDVGPTHRTSLPDQHCYRG